MNVARGRCPFDSTCLKSGLSTNADALDFREYLAFYGLDNLMHLESHEVQVLNVPIDGGQNIVVQTFKPAQPRGWALFHHGYYDHAGLFAYIYAYLLERHVAVIAFDQIGHGLSTGQAATIPTFDHYVKVIEAVIDGVCATVNPPLHLVGQSMGGALLLEYLHRHPEREVGETVLLAPLVRPYAWWINRIYFYFAKRFMTERPRRITSNASNAEFLYLQHHDPLQARVLPVEWVEAMVEWFTRFERYPVSSRAPKIVQGHQDRTISWRHSIDVLGSQYPEASWCHIDAASHHLANESDAIRSQMFTWLDEHCRWV